MPELRVAITIVALALAMVISAFIAHRQRVGSVLLALLSVVWLTVDRFYEGAVLVVVSNRHGFVASDIVGVLGLIAAVWFWVRPGR